MHVARTPRARSGSSRSSVSADEDGLTVMKTYKTGDVEVAHPLLAELPRHVESANKCLMTISSMIKDRGAKKQNAGRDLDKFRLHA